MLVENNLAALWRQLDKAEQKLAEANKELRSAERKADRASAVVSNLREEIALEKLRLWGDKPDLAELMASDRKNSTMVFYKALEAVAASRGFYIGGMWSDTKQTVLGFGLNRSEIGGIERVAEGIRYFAPSMKTIKGGWVRFAVSSLDSESCAWSLRYSRVRAMFSSMAAITSCSLQAGTMMARGCSGRARICSAVSAWCLGRTRSLR